MSAGRYDRHPGGPVGAGTRGETDPPTTEDLAAVIGLAARWTSGTPSLRQALRTCAVLTRIGAVLMAVTWGAALLSVASLAAEFPAAYGSNPAAFAAVTATPVAAFVLSLICTAVSFLAGARSAADRRVRSETVTWALIGLAVATFAPFLIALFEMGNG